MSLRAKTFRSNATGVAAEVRARRFGDDPVVADVDPVALLEADTDARGPTRAGEDVALDVESVGVHDEDPDDVGLHAAVADDRVVRVHEVRAVPAAPYDVLLEQDATRVPDDHVARVLHDAPAHDGVGRFPELDAVAPQLGLVVRTADAGVVEQAARTRPERDAEERVFHGHVRDARARRLGLDARVFDGVPTAGVTDGEVVDPDVVSRDRDDGPRTRPFHHRARLSVERERPRDDEIAAVDPGAKPDLRGADGIRERCRESAPVGGEERAGRGSQLSGPRVLGESGGTREVGGPPLGARGQRARNNRHGGP